MGFSSYLLAWTGVGAGAESTTPTPTEKG